MSADYNGEYFVIGPPGTGKTTFLARQVERVLDRCAWITGQGSPVIVSSLTKTAAAEVAGRDTGLPDKAVATLHSHAHRSSGCPPVAAGSAVRPFNEEYRWLALNDSEADYDDDLGRRPSSVEFPGEALRERAEILRHWMVPREKWPPSVEEFFWRWEAFKKESGLVDFTDMIESAAPVPPMDPEVVICDEAQDMSKLEWSVIHRWGNEAGALIASGDPWQGLYDWRGADVDYLSGRDPERVRVLGQSYRIPQSVHEEARQWVSQLSTYDPDIQFKPRDAEGSVDRLPVNLSECWPVVQQAAACAKEGKSVMILASCNYLVDPIVASLRANALPFSNPWRRKNGRWNPLGRRKGVSTPDRLRALIAPILDNRVWTVEEFYLWVSMCLEKGLLARGAKKKLREMAEREDMKGRPVTHALLDLVFISADSDSIFDFTVTDALGFLRGKLMKKYERADYPMRVVERRGLAAITEEPKIHVGTIHSVKGGEADVVFLFPDLSDAGAKAFEHDIDGSRDSVVRAFYVGMTRARESLYLCDPMSKGRSAF